MHDSWPVLLPNGIDFIVEFARLTLLSVTFACSGWELTLTAMVTLHSIDCSTLIPKPDSTSVPQFSMPK